MTLTYMDAQTGQRRTLGNLRHVEFCLAGTIRAWGHSPVPTILRNAQWHYAELDDPSVTEEKGADHGRPVL